jgi:hypothetical protein
MPRNATVHKTATPADVMDKAHARDHRARSRLHEMLWSDAPELISKSVLEIGSASYAFCAAAGSEATFSISHTS